MLALASGIQRMREERDQATAKLRLRRISLQEDLDEREMFHSELLQAQVFH